jgi:hypothetical protein
MKCQPLCGIIILLVTQNYCFEFTRCLIPVFFAFTLIYVKTIKLLHANLVSISLSFQMDFWLMLTQFLHCQK